MTKTAGAINFVSILLLFRAVAVLFPQKEKNEKVLPAE